MWSSCEGRQEEPGEEAGNCDIRWITIDDEAPTSFIPECWKGRRSERLVTQLHTCLVCSWPALTPCLLPHFHLAQCSAKISQTQTTQILQCLFLPQLLQHSHSHPPHPSHHHYAHHLQRSHPHKKQVLSSLPFHLVSEIHDSHFKHEETLTLSSIRTSRPTRGDGRELSQKMILSSASGRDKSRIYKSLDL